MTPAEVITEVRKLVQDETVPFRYSDTMLLGFVMQTVQRMAVLRPDLFSTITEMNTTPCSFVQTIPRDGARLVEIFAVKGGKAVQEVSRDVMDRNFPGWTMATEGVPVNYMRHPRNPTRYFLYPPPTQGTKLIAEYVQAPIFCGINERIQPLNDIYFPIVVQGTVFMTESIDNEHANSGRAKLYDDAFNMMLTSNFESRTVTDIEDGGLPKHANLNNG